MGHKLPSVQERGRQAATKCGAAQPGPRCPNCGALDRHADLLERAVARIAQHGDDFDAVLVTWAQEARETLAKARGQ